MFRGEEAGEEAARRKQRRRNSIHVGAEWARLRQAAGGGSGGPGLGLSCFRGALVAPAEWASPAPREAHLAMASSMKSAVDCLVCGARAEWGAAPPHRLHCTRLSASWPCLGMPVCAPCLCWCPKILSEPEVEAPGGASSTLWRCVLTAGG